MSSRASERRKTHSAERTGNVLFKHLHGHLIEEDTELLLGRNAFI